MSTFSSDQFLSTRQTGALDTKYPVCPPGEYQGMIDKLDVRQQEIKKGERAGEIMTVLDISWEILDDRIREMMGRPKVLVRQAVFLDLTVENQLDLGTGKNVKLGKVREALNQNDPKREWFPNMLLGGTAKVRVNHTPNEKDSEQPYANVDEVAPLR